MSKNTPTTTLLGKKIAAGANAPAASSVSATPLSRVVAGRRGELVDLPGIGPAYIVIPGDRRWLELDAEVNRAMAELGYEGGITVLNAHLYESEKARRALSIAVRDPDNHDAPFGTLEEWNQVGTDIVSAAWHVFGDVREHLDPFGSILTEDEAHAIAAAVKKKDAALLRSFGLGKLSAWLATTESPPSTSPIQSSPSSESPPASSE